MKKVIWLLSLLSVIMFVSAYHSYAKGGYAIPTNVHPYTPVAEIWSSVMPISSDLQAWHASEGRLSFVRTLGVRPGPTGIEIARPLNVRDRADREGYTAIYGVERQVIVPWRVKR